MLPAQWACAAWFSRHQTFQKWLMALIVLLVFSFAGTFVYMALEPEWNLFDAVSHAAAQTLHYHVLACR